MAQPVLDPTLVAPTTQQPTIPDASLNSLGTPQLPYTQTNMVGLDSNSPDAGSDVNTAPSILQAPDAQNGNASSNDTSNPTGTDASGDTTSNSEVSANRTLGQLDTSLPADEQSYENTILGTYNARQAATQQGSAAAAQGIENNSNEDIYYQQQENQNELTSAEESRRGFATNTAMFAQMQDTGQKRIRDLEKQRDDYLLQNDQNNADQINQLIIGEQQAITTARQNYYTNQFSLLEKQQTQEQFEYGKTPTQRLSALATVRQQLFNSGADPSELAMIDQMITDTATGGGTTAPGGGTGGVAGSSTLGTQGDVSGQTGQSYDFSTYSTNPKYSSVLSQLTNSTSTLTSADDIQGYITKLYSGAPVTGQMITDAAESAGVDPTVMTAQLQLESHFGTTGEAPANMNPAGIEYVGQPDAVQGSKKPDGGYYAKFDNWQDGLNAEAQWLANHHSTALGTNAATGASSPDSQATLQATYYQQLANGTPPSEIASSFGGGLSSAQYIALQNATTKYYTDNPTQSIGSTDINYQSMLGASKDLADQAGTKLLTINKLTAATQTLLNLSDKFARSGVTTLNDQWLKSQLAINNPDAIAFNEAAGVITDDIGNVFASNSTLTDAKLNFASGIINEDYSPAGMKAALTTLNSLMGIQASAYNQVLSNPSGLGTGRTLSGGTTSQSGSGNTSSTSNRTLSHPVGSKVTSGGRTYVVSHIIGADGSNELIPVS